MLCKFYAAGKQCNNSNCKFLHKRFDTPCKFFLEGKCTNKLCPYKHEQKPCKFFLAGNCKNKTCSFKHDKEEVKFDSNRLCPAKFFSADKTCTNENCPYHHERINYKCESLLSGSKCTVEGCVYYHGVGINELCPSQKTAKDPVTCTDKRCVYAHSPFNKLCPSMRASPVECQGERCLYLHERIPEMCPDMIKHKTCTRQNSCPYHHAKVETLCECKRKNCVYYHEKIPIRCSIPDCDGKCVYYHKSVNAKCPTNCKDKQCIFRHDTIIPVSDEEYTYIKLYAETEIECKEILLNASKKICHKMHWKTALLIGQVQIVQ